MPKIIETDNFKRIKTKLDLSYLIRLEKLIKKIISNPEIGKPMRNVRKGTRELYVGKFRLSYQFDKSKDIVFLLDFYHKKHQ
jgi:mRNA-degrading endonuclease RelE of RelBE toxin-antitoxin system